jgi:hypothetical protein
VRCTALAVCRIPLACLALYMQLPAPCKLRVRLTAVACPPRAPCARRSAHFLDTHLDGHSAPPLHHSIVPAASLRLASLRMHPPCSCQVAFPRRRILQARTLRKHYPCTAHMPVISPVSYSLPLTLTLRAPLVSSLCTAHVSAAGSGSAHVRAPVLLSPHSANASRRDARAWPLLAAHA